MEEHQHENKSSGKKSEPHTHENPHRQWSKQDTRILKDAEHLFRYMRKALTALDKWSMDVNHHIAPEALDAEFMDRVTHVMWKADLLEITVKADHPGEAIHNLLGWCQQYMPPGLMQVKMLSPEEFEKQEQNTPPGQYL